MSKIRLDACCIEGNKVDEQTFTVELDFSAMFQIDVEAIDAREAYDKAVRMLNGEEIDQGSCSIRKIESFQVYDERMQPCDVTTTN